MLKVLEFRTNSDYQQQILPFIFTNDTRSFISICPIYAKVEIDQQEHILD